MGFFCVNVLVMKNYLITESQLERITNLIISEQSVVGAPNFGTIGGSDRFTNKKNETKPIKGFDCVPYAFRYPSSNLKGKGYNPLFIKASLGTIGREQVATDLDIAEKLAQNVSPPAEGAHPEASHPVLMERDDPVVAEAP